MEYASPATIARVGVVFVDAAELSIEPVWQRWLHQRNDNDQERLQVRAFLFPFEQLSLNEFISDVAPLR